MIFNKITMLWMKWCSKKRCELDVVLVTSESKDNKDRMEDYPILKHFNYVFLD